MATLRQNLISAVGASCLVMGGYWGLHLWRTNPDAAGRARVVDGDTLDVGSQRVRLYGIDAPEMGQSCTTATGQAWACGHEAKTYLEKLVKDQWVTCKRRDTDVYGRMIATCKAAGVELGLYMVRAGLAVAYTRYTDRYRQDETMAVNAKRGMWAGKFQPPESWRRDHYDWQGR
jgi:endonuclease YncB( thermonuclease family)